MSELHGILAPSPAPRVVVRLDRPAPRQEVFSPLTPPREMGLALQAIHPSLLDRLHAQVELDLREGTVEVPLFEDQVFPVAIAPDTRARGWVTLGRMEASRPDEILVTSATLTFEPALVLHDVGPVLARLHTLFQDRELVALREQLKRLAATGPAAAGLSRARSAWSRRIRPRLERLLPDELRDPSTLRRFSQDVFEGADQIAQVELRQVVAFPDRRAGTWQLDLRFSGDIRTLAGAAVPFDDLRVPHVILPMPHADLARLASPDPLASAHLRRDRLHLARLTEALAAAAGAFRGHVYLKSRIPEGGVSFLLGDGGIAQALATLPGLVTARGEFTGTLAPDLLELQVPDLELDLAGGRIRMETILCVEAPLARSGGPSLVARAIDAWRRRTLPQEGIGWSAQVHFDDACRVPSLPVRLHHHHPLLLGSFDADLTVEDLAFAGRASLADPADPTLPQHRTFDLCFGGRLATSPGSFLDTGGTRAEVKTLSGPFHGHVRHDDAGTAISLQATSAFDLLSRTRTDPFPELDLHAEAVEACVRGTMEADLHLRGGSTRGGVVALDFQGSAVTTTLADVRVHLADRSLTLPAGSRFDARVPEGTLAATGLGQARFDVTWDLQGQSPVLARADDRVEIFVPPLRSGTLTVGLSPTGRLTVSGREGDLYDAHYFNALLNPVEELARWQEILADAEAVDKVLGAVRIFSPDGARMLGEIRRFADRARAILADEGVTEPRHAIPGLKIARILSRLLVDTPDLTDRLYPLVKRVTDGEGLDVRATRLLLDEVLPDHDWGYELDRGLRWAAFLFRPMDPEGVREVQDALPLVERPDLRAALVGLPSAGSIYAALRAPGPVPAPLARAIARVAPYLTLEQLDWILARPVAGWPGEARFRVETVADLKRRIRAIKEGYGGFGFAPQARAIDFFLGMAIELSRRDAEATTDDLPTSDLPTAEDPDATHRSPLTSTLLGPEDIAVLLHAGLTQPIQARACQLNQRLLLDLVLAEPPSFLHQVLVELGHGSARVLASALNALLELDQDLLRSPLDLPAIFTERLGIEFPRLQDYMAGGRWARMSYYEALNHTAEQVLSFAEPYYALRTWLQVERHPVLPVAEPTDSEQSSRSQVLETQALEAIARADDLSRDLPWKGRKEAPHRRAIVAWEEAFEACRAVQRADRFAFQRPWFKAFWARNHEALVVWSVVRNVQEDMDEVRHWLRVRTGKPVPRSEDALVDAVIGALYYHPQDRARLQADPLVRLLVDPPEGRLDFTIVSCMGVVTDGEKGRELEQAYQRITERRGVRVLRANTANVRSLEFNAERVEEAIRRAETPWGLIGYSQGCANALMAESRLRGGTPDQQALLHGLRCRNFLFSAVNGSAHGSLGDRKFLGALVMGDQILSHYQAVLSAPAIRLALRGLRLFLDAPPLIMGLSGTFSLSHEGVLPLAREGQFLDGVPSSAMRGVVEPETLPEALELLANLLTRQIESPLHDTQVAVHEAVGHPVWFRNPNADILERCDMGSLVQRTHHWSPLMETTEFLTTERDIVRAIYDVPKDRHVFPWVEVCARFGVI